MSAPNLPGSGHAVATTGSSEILCFGGLAEPTAERPTLARQITNVREGVEACRKHLKAAEGIFSRSRAEIQAAANGVSAAVKLSRKS